MGGEVAGATLQIPAALKRLAAAAAAAASAADAVVLQGFLVCQSFNWCVTPQLAAECQDAKSDWPSVRQKKKKKQEYVKSLEVIGMIMGCLLIICDKVETGKRFQVLFFLRTGKMEHE